MHKKIKNSPKVNKFFFVPNRKAGRFYIITTKGSSFNY